MEVENTAPMRLELPQDDAMEVDAPAPPSLGSAGSVSSPLVNPAEQPPPNSIPSPPAVKLSASDSPPCAKAKLDEFFFRYLATQESKNFLGGLMDDVRAGKNIAAEPKYNTLRSISGSSIATATSPNAGTANHHLVNALPGSPVSRLMRSHSPFGEHSPRSPVAAATASAASDSDLVRTSVLSLSSDSNSKSGDDSDQQQLRAFVLDGEANEIAKSTTTASVDVNMSNASTTTDHVSQTTIEQPLTEEDAIMQPAEGRTANGFDAMQVSHLQNEKRERSLPSSRETDSGTSTGIGSSNTSAEPDSSKDHPRSTVDLIAEQNRSAIQPPVKETTNRTRPPAPRPGADVRMPDASAQSPRKRLPRFYYPCGRDAEKREHRERVAIRDFFKAQRVNKRLEGASKGDIGELVVEVVGVPSYFAALVYTRITKWYPLNSRQQPDSNSRTEHMSADSMRSNGDDATMKDTSASEPNGELNRSGVGTEPPNGTLNRANSDLITEEQFIEYYERECAGRSKDERLFRALLDPGADRNYLIPADFKALLRALLTCHQGLAFLHATPEFQHRYSETVIERIYFGCTRKHNGRLTLADIRRSRLLDTLVVVDEEEDINRERKYFSYEHFYVLYCRFWELDTNHDLQIDREDLMRYGGHSLTFRIVDRIFGGHARPLDGHAEKPGMMSYTDFIWFCLSEEDKTSDTAIDYWFRCVDLDGDGLITMFDMEFFYQEQLHRMECFGHEPVAIRDILCQLLDMVKPNAKPPVIRRRDLKKCRLSGNFFNILFNLNKFFALEARDPLQIRQEHATPELTDWDRFAAIEYLRLSAEEEDDNDAWDDVPAENSAAPLMAGEAPF